MFTSRKPTSRSVLICSALTLAALLIGLAQWRGLKPAAAAPLTAFASCPAPQFGTTANFPAGNIPRAVALSDFNLDGKQDVAVAYGGGLDLTVMLGNGDGTLQPGVNYTLGHTPLGVAVGDFNQDGKPDLVAAIQVNVAILLGNGNGTFQPAVNYLVFPFSNNGFVAVSDYNRDGKQDLAVTTYGDNKVSILLGNGDGSFQAATSYATGTTPSSVVAGDFNRDGNQDLAVTNEGTDNNISILLGNGNGTFQPRVNYSLGTAQVPYLVASGDFNADGKLDIATANFNSDNLSVLLGNGNGTFGTAVNYPVATRPGSVALADFNSDGKVDLAAGNSGVFAGDYNVAVMLGNGDAAGTFQARVNFGGMSNYPVFTAAGDLNGDRKSDLITADDPNTLGYVSTLLNTCACTPPDVTLTAPAQVCASSTGNTISIPSAGAGASYTWTNYSFNGTITGGAGTNAITFTAGATGTMTLGVTVTNAGGCTASKLIYIPINPVPTLGNYLETGPVSVGTSGINNTPSAPPNQGTVNTLNTLTATASAGFTGSLSVNKTTGVVTINNAGPQGIYTVTVTATDYCGATASKMFGLTVGSPPMITAAAALTRQQGSPAGAAVTVATVSDAEQAAGTLSVVVIAGGTATGITLGAITNTNGTISAPVLAECTATPGTVKFQVTDSIGLLATSDLQVNVTANTPPTLGNYPSAGTINVGTGTTVTPTAAPSDNVVVATFAPSVPGFMGSISGNPTSGVVTISNANPPGNYTVTVTAIDNCGVAATRTFSLTVNGLPTIMGKSISVVAGAGTTVATIATVSDDLTAAGSLVVTAGTLPTGITLTGISNTGGTITANVAADCSAAVGVNTVILQVTDGNGAAITSNLNITVTQQLNSATGGTADLFLSPTEPVTRRTAFSNAFPQPANPAWKRFDATTANRLLGYSFKTLPSNIVKAELIVRMKPQGAASADDSLNLGLVPPNTFAYTRTIANLPGTGGTWVSNAPVTFTLDLANLPGGGNLLAKITTDKYLDVLIREDTAVDYMKLRYWTCPPAPMFRGTQFAAEGQATVAIAPNGSLLIGNFGGTGNDGAVFNMGAPLLSAGAGVSFVPDGGQIIETPGGELNLSISGQFGGIDQTLGTVKLKTAQTANDKDTLSTDFTPLGVSSYLVQVYSGNTLVKTFSGHSGQNIGYQNCPSLLAPTAKSIPGIDNTARRKPGAPACPQTRVTFGRCTQFDFGPGYGVSQGDMVVLTSTIELNYTESCVLSEARVTGTNYGQFALSALNVIALNQTFQTLGEAHIGAFGDTVTISNIRTSGTLPPGASGQDGTNIVFDQPGVKIVSARLLPFDDATIPAGAYLQGSMRGTLNGIPNQALGTMRENRSATGYVVTTDFDALTPATRSLRLTNNGVSVIVVDGFNGPVDTSSSWNTYTRSKSNTAAPLTAPNASQTARTRLGSQTSNAMTLAASYPANTVFKINGTDYVGDQLEFSAVGVNGTAIGDFSAFELTAADIPEYTITEVQTIPEDNPPTIATVAIARQAGSLGSTSTIANVTDVEDSKNNLTVKVNNAATATVNGVTVSGLNVDSAGVVTANVVAACGATNASFALTVIDSGGSTISTGLDVTVVANDLPMLAYNASQTVAAGGATTINPTFGPTDNGSVTGIAVQSLGTFTGTLTVDNTTGVVSVSNAKPGGSHTITIRVTDNCGATKDTSFTLTVTCPSITVTPPTLPNGIVGASYGTQTLSASGGSAPYAFTLDSGTLPDGIMLSGIALTGTPTATGVFNFTIKATDNNGCVGMQSYTVVISGTGLQFYPLAHPVRMVDTRVGATACQTPGAAITGGTSLTVPARGVCDGLTIPANAAAVTGNVTTVGPVAAGFLTIYPNGATRPQASNSNYQTSQTLNNVFTVGLGAADGAFNVFALSTTNVVVDVTGYFAPPGANGLFFHPLPAPVRLLDTRAGQTACTTPGTPLLAATEFLQQGNAICGIPATALALVGNATTVGPLAQGFLTLFPADATRPNIASGNYQSGQTLNSPFTVGLSPSGQFKIYSLQQTNLVVDVLGYYSADASDTVGIGLLFSPMTPARLLDTRAGQTACFTPGVAIPATTDTPQAARGTCTIPATAQAIVGNATTVSPVLGGFLTFWPSNATRPNAATSNFAAGVNFNRHYTVGLGADGAFNIYALTSTHLVVDVSGSFAP